MKVCLVTEQFGSIGFRDGTGEAFLELALLFVDEGAGVDVLCCPREPVDASLKSRTIREMELRGVTLNFLDQRLYVIGRQTVEGRSFAAFRYLLDGGQPYDQIHFDDQGGLGHFAMSAKKQGLALATPLLILHLRAPTRWSLEAATALPSHPDHLKADHLEKQCARHADIVVSRSQFLVDWCRKHDFRLPEDGRMRVIPDANLLLLPRTKSGSQEEQNHQTEDRPRELVFSSFLDEQEGLTIFFDVLDLLSPELAMAGVKVTFLGAIGSIGGRTSGIDLAERARNWRFPIEVLSHLQHEEAFDYLRGHRDALLVVCSPKGGNPGLLAQAGLIGIRAVVPDLAITREMVGGAEAAFSGMDSLQFAGRIRMALAGNGARLSLAEPPEVSRDGWLSLRTAVAATFDHVETAVHTAEQPRVVLGITHYERPAKLIEAVASALRQTYENVQVVVVDDGSRSDQAVKALDEVESLLRPVGGFVIRKPKNEYLGAARNTIAAATQSDFLCFLDDDDIAMPDLIERLVSATRRSGADIMNCLNIFMPELRRMEAWPRPEEFGERVSYVPTGGPLSLSPFENCFGAATALIRRTTFESIGGYTPLRGTGYEDYEFYVRALQAGAHLDVCPVPLYLYETGRPSMVNTTSFARNRKRVVDALDFRSDADSWRDAMAMQAGREASDRMHRRASRRIHGTREASLATSASTPGLSVVDRLARLAAYADAIDSPLAGSAFRRAMRLAAGDGDGDVGGDQLPVPSAASVHQDPVPALAPGFATARTRLALGDYRGAIDNLLPAIRGRSALGEQEWMIVEAIARAPLSGEAIARLDTVLSRMADSGNESPAPFRARFFVARSLGDKDRALAMCMACIDADERAYLATHADVSKAVAAGRIESGMTHFRKWGYAEARRGFESSSMLARSFEPKAHPWDLLDLARPQRD